MCGVGVPSCTTSSVHSSPEVLPGAVSRSGTRHSSASDLTAAASAVAEEALPAAAAGEASSGAAAADSPPPEGARVSDVPPIVAVQTGYPSLGAIVQLWGPTADPGVLETFLDAHADVRAWGLDCKTAAAAAVARSGSSVSLTGSGGGRPGGGGGRVTLLTLSTADAALVWNVAGGGLPARLQAWLRDASIWKCRVSAEALVGALAKTEGARACGVVDLRRMHAQVEPHAAEVRCCVPRHILSSSRACSVLCRRGRVHCWLRTPLQKLLPDPHAGSVVIRLTLPHSSTVASPMHVPSTSTAAHPSMSIHCSRSTQPTSETPPPVLRRHRYALRCHRATVRRLQAAGTCMQGPQGKLPAVVLAVLGVRISPSTALNQSDWASWPLSAAQAHYTMQAAWLHAHLLQRLAPRIGWQTPALASCVAAADGSAATGDTAADSKGLRGGDGEAPPDAPTPPATIAGLRGTSTPVDAVTAST